MFTIPESLYVGRSFSPVVEFPAPGVVGGTTYNTSSQPLGPNGVACIPISVPNTKGWTLSVSANIEPNAKWDDKYPAGAPTMLSITKDKADFSHNAMAGVGAGGSIQGVVGITSSGPRGNRLLTLEPGDYWINVAPRDKDVPYDLRISTNIQTP